MGNKAGVGIDILTVMYTKVSGKMILSKARGLCGIPIRINMKDSGSRGRKMDGESISITMQLYMKATSLMAESMALGQ